MTVAVAGVPSSRRTPGQYIFVDLGTSAAGAGTAATRVLLLGNMIAANITGSSPSFTVTAGSRQSSGTATETPLQVNSPYEAEQYFGSGSELHLGAIMFFDMCPDGQLWCCPVSEGATPTAASATLTITGTATASGTLRVVVNGVTIDQGVTSGLLGSAANGSGSLSELICKAINAVTTLPATAQFSNTTGTGTVTVTAKHGGPRGSNIRFYASWITTTGIEIPIGSSATSSAFGVSCAITGSGKLASGATADSVANALTAIANQQFDRLVLAHTDTTNINLVVAELDARNAGTVMLWGQGIAATVKSPNAAVTDSDSIDAKLMQLVEAENCLKTTIEMAAQVCAARLNGDTLAGGSLPGEDQDPAANLNYLELRSIPAPPVSAPSDMPTSTEIESMLLGGVAPLAPSSTRPGKMCLVSSVTTKHKGPNAGTFDYSVAKTKVPTVSHYLARIIRADLAKTFRGYKLAADPADGSPVRIPRVVTPSMIRERILLSLRRAEADGIITQVDTFLDELVVEIDSLNNQRVNANIPEFPIPDLDIVAARLAQRSA
jgi:phage tail sheath gpL-like